MLTMGLAAACGRAKIGAPAPEPFPLAGLVVPPAESVAVVSMEFEATADDSAADEATLAALDTLEIKSAEQDARGRSGLRARAIPSVDGKEVAGTAADMFYKLNSNSKRQVASDFYKMGVSDDVKNLYWAQRRMQEPCYDDERPALQRKYVTVWVPDQKGPSGTITEGHYKVIEIVE